MMEKWADYLISAIRCNDISVTHLKVHSDAGINISGGSTWTREEVLSALNEGKKFFTILKNSNGSWKKGKEFLKNHLKEKTELYKELQEF